MLEKIRAQGAEVTVHGENWNAADELARSMLAADPSAEYIPPYEHPLLWEASEAMRTLQDRLHCRSRRSDSDLHLGSAATGLSTCVAGPLLDR